MDIKKEDRLKIARKYRRAAENYLIKTTRLSIGIRRRFFKNRLGQAAASQARSRPQD